MTKKQKEDRIIEIDYQITAAAGIIYTNTLRIRELNEANERHANDIQKINVERVRLIGELQV